MEALRDEFRNMECADRCSPASSQALKWPGGLALMVKLTARLLLLLLLDFSSEKEWLLPLRDLEWVSTSLSLEPTLEMPTSGGWASFLAS